jgi:hypothetical protein
VQHHVPHLQRGPAAKKKKELFTLSVATAAGDNYTKMHAIAVDK